MLTYSEQTKDTRLTRCKHPLLRQALAFRPNTHVRSAESELQLEVLNVSKDLNASRRPVEATVELGPVARTFIKFMEVAVSGMKFMVAPL